jgi:hypothetical protein
MAEYMLVVLSLGTQTFLNKFLIFVLFPMKIGMYEYLVCCKTRSV